MITNRCVEYLLFSRMECVLDLVKTRNTCIGFLKCDGTPSHSKVKNFSRFSRNCLVLKKGLSHICSALQSGKTIRQ